MEQPIIIKSTFQVTRKPATRGISPIMEIKKIRETLQTSPNLTQEASTLRNINNIRIKILNILDNLTEEIKKHERNNDKHPLASDIINFINKIKSRLENITSSIQAIKTLESETINTQITHDIYFNYFPEDHGHTEITDAIPPVGFTFMKERNN